MNRKSFLNFQMKNEIGLNKTVLDCVFIRNIDLKLVNQSEVIWAHNLYKHIWKFISNAHIIYIFQISDLPNLRFFYFFFNLKI